MATVSHSLNAVAAATGARHEDLRFRARVLREGGLLPQGGRGFGAAHLEVEDLVNLLLGIMLVERGITTTMLERLRRAQRLQWMGCTIESSGAPGPKRRTLSAAPPAKDRKVGAPSAPLIDRADADFSRTLRSLTFARALEWFVETATTERGREDLSRRLNRVMVQSDGKIGIIRVECGGWTEANWYGSPPRTVLEPKPVLTPLAPMIITATFHRKIFELLADLAINTRHHQAAQMKTGAEGGSNAPADGVISLATAMKG